MNVTRCEFHVGAMRAEDFPRDGLPEIAFMGRSNVGKSSLINRLLGVRGLARTSKTPGRTRAIHFFRVSDRLYFVDLPGYGYARVPIRVRREWRRLVESYLERPGRPHLAVQIVDARREPTDQDAELLDWLRARRVPRLVVLTKADKLSRNDRSRALDRSARRFGLAPEERSLAVSATSGDGIPALWREIDAAYRSARAVRRAAPPPAGDGPRDREPRAGRSPSGAAEA